MIAVIAALAFFEVKLSSRILGVALMCEVVTLIVFDIVMFANGARLGQCDQPGQRVQGPARRAFRGHGAGRRRRRDRHLLRLLVLGGLGDGAQLRRGVQGPADATCPARCTSRSSAWGSSTRSPRGPAISGYSHFSQTPSNTAQNNSAAFFFIPAQHYSGLFLKDCLSWFIITGSFACGMAFHNTTARYMYSLGREGVLPAGARAAPTPSTPARTSPPTSQSVIAALILLAFVLFATVDSKLGAADSVGYLQVYGLMAVMGVVSILAIQALVSVAIFNYFRTHHAADHHWWTTMLAPVLAAISQAYVLYLAISNLKFLGSGYGYAKWLCWADLVIFLGGLGYAYYLKSQRPGQVRDGRADDQPGARSV